MDEVYIKKEDLGKWIAKYFKKDLISIYDLLNCIESLDEDVDYWKDKYEELERDLEDNYKPISKADQYEISEDDFI